jgi:hypothetical protein
MEFPRTVYVKGPGMEVVGGTLTPLLVCDEAEYNAALKDGYFPSVPEALAEKLDAPLAEEAASEEAASEEAPPETAKKRKKASLQLNTRPVYE